MANTQMNNQEEIPSVLLQGRYETDPRPKQLGMTTHTGYLFILLCEKQASTCLFFGFIIFLLFAQLIHACAKRKHILTRI